MKIFLFKRLIVILVLPVLLLSSCVSKKDIIYVQDIDDTLSKEKSLYETTIAKDDVLRIIVSSANMESVLPFNQVVGSVSNQDLSVRSQEALQSYLVDKNGTIKFPVLGSIEVSGLTREALEQQLQNQLLKYVKDVSVDVRILNYKITILGEVTRPGTFTIEHNRITLLQALGLAGDLTVYGKRDNIIVIRDVNGVQKSARVDLTSSEFIYSPYYYLNQNDTVIVEPNGAQVQASGFNRNVSIYVSIASLLLTTIVVFSNLNR